MINRTQEGIMQNWDMDNSENPLVSVKCLTYNHEEFIAQALDGILMQKTNFPFEVIVHDDASTDKTATVIREYEEKFPKIIKPIYEIENQYSKLDGSLTKIVNSACKGKYFATCEGDDYWIDENKLQMQVDFLENNPSYGMCYSMAKKFIQKKRKFSNTKFGAEIKNFEDLLNNGNRIPTLTACVRRELITLYMEKIKPDEKKWLMGDYPLWLFIAHESKIFFHKKVFAVYRVLEESASHSKFSDKKISFGKSGVDIKHFFYTLYTNRQYCLERGYFRVYALYYYKFKEKSLLEEMHRLYPQIEQPNLLDKFYNITASLPYPCYYFLFSLKEIVKKLL